jgi:hypothetical protein
MSDVTHISSQIEAGDLKAAPQLLPIVYNELRRLAAIKLSQENPGQTLQATALVHEAYVRLVDSDRVRHWHSRGHFFVAAAEADPVPISVPGCVRESVRVYSACGVGGRGVAPTGDATRDAAGNTPACPSIIFAAYAAGVCHFKPLWGRR